MNNAVRLDCRAKGVRDSETHVQDTVRSEEEQLESRTHCPSPLASNPAKAKIEAARLRKRIRPSLHQFRTR